MGDAGGGRAPQPAAGGVLVCPRAGAPVHGCQRRPPNRRPSRARISPAKRSRSTPRSGRHKQPAQESASKTAWPCASKSLTVAPATNPRNKPPQQAADPPPRTQGCLSESTKALPNSCPSDQAPKQTLRQTPPPNERLSESTAPRFRALNAAVAQLLDEFSLVSFLALVGGPFFGGGQTCGSLGAGLRRRGVPLGGQAFGRLAAGLRQACDWLGPLLGGCRRAAGGFLGGGLGRPAPRAARPNALPVLALKTTPLSRQTRNTPSPPGRSRRGLDSAVSGPSNPSPAPPRTPPPPRKPAAPKTLRPPQDITDEDSIGEVLAHTDLALQFGEDADVKIRETAADRDDGE